MTKPTKQEQLAAIESQRDDLDRTMRNKAKLTILLTILTSLNIIFYLTKNDDPNFFKNVIPDLELSENVVIPSKMIAYAFVVFSVIYTFSQGKELYSLKKHKSQLEQSQTDLTSEINPSKIFDVTTKTAESKNVDGVHSKKPIKHQIEDIQTKITTNSRKISKEITNVLGFGGINLLCAYYFFSSILSSEKNQHESISIGKYCIPAVFIVQIPLAISTAVTTKSFYNYYKLSKENDRLENHLEQLSQRKSSISRTEIKSHTAAQFTKPLRIKISNNPTGSSKKYMSFISSNTTSQLSKKESSTQHYPKKHL